MANGSVKGESCKIGLGKVELKPEWTSFKLDERDDGASSGTLKVKWYRHLRTKHSEEVRTSSLSNAKCLLTGLATKF